MNCKAIHKKLIFFLENDLPLNEMEEIRLHLAGCQECAAFADYMKKSLSVLDQERNPDVNPFFYTRLKARMENQAIKETVTPLWARILQPAVFTLLLLAGVYAGIKIGQPAKINIQESYYAEQEMFPYLYEMAAEPIETFLME
jgi:hypothetical protein